RSRGRRRVVDHPHLAISRPQGRRSQGSLQRAEPGARSSMFGKDIVAAVWASATIADWIQMALLLTAVVALGFNARGYILQARANDVENYLRMKDQFAEAWRRYRDASDEDGKSFELIEILNLMETCCHLIETNAFRRASRVMLTDYLKETIPAVFDNSDAREVVQRHLFGPDTFFYIRRFARRHGLARVPQQ
ncbi:MAG: hypothetical protein RMK81_04730, partial [Geminicoccaceae bacterium]|nr:hypothetical protein [Geminicoccaceae bacterium]